MNRRRGGSLAGNPLLIGAVTTLIVVVAVYLAYNANNGLPFVPTYDVKVALPQASGLQPTSQVRIGGTRVGVVTSLIASVTFWRTGLSGAWAIGRSRASCFRRALNCSAWLLSAASFFAESFSKCIGRSANCGLSAAADKLLSDCGLSD